MMPEEHGRVQAGLKAGADTVPMGAPFNIEVSLCSEDGESFDRVSVDAVMPAHQHGMNYRPEITRTGENRFKASGMVFHMPGTWRFMVSAFGAGEPSHFTFEQTLK